MQMTQKQLAARFYISIHYQRGLDDGWAGKVYDPPRWNPQDRAAYRKGFDAARKDKHGV